MVQTSVSVVIPTYNRADALSQALTSVYAQSHQPFEVIVVDDGSTDETAMVVAGFEHVVYVYQDNQGVSAARNRGIELSKGTFIAFLDSDDTWFPTKLAMQLECIKQTQLRVCHTEEIWIRNGVRVNQKKKHRKSGGDQFERCIELCCISPSSVLIERTVFEDYGDFDESLPACEDYDLWLRICAFEHVCFVSAPQIYKFGGHADQLSRAFPAMDRFRLVALNKLLERNVLDLAQTACVVASVRKRINVLWMGALKHDNLALIETLRPLKKRWAPDDE
jgi:GT2 family glycosyltransferase